MATQQRPKKKSRKRNSASDSVRFGSVSAATNKKLQERLASAANAFQAERFDEADRMLQSITKIAPGVAEVHELQGLTYYRMGKWVKAIAEFEAFGKLTGSVEQHPVWADCCRALKRWNEMDRLWKELGAVSPGPELVEEGRIVQAGSLADRDRLRDAIRFLEKAPSPKKSPSVYHLRRWYVLGDLYERAGDNPKARRIFSQIIKNDPQFGDASERLAALG